MSEKKTETLIVRITKTERRWVEKEAKKFRSISDFIRDFLFNEKR